MSFQVLGAWCLGYFWPSAPRNGRGEQKDMDEVARLWRGAAEQGHAIAQFNLGVLYDTGKGVEVDNAKAMELYQKAAEQGDADAQHNLGNMYGRSRSRRRTEPSS